MEVWMDVAMICGRDQEDGIYGEYVPVYAVCLFMVRVLYSTYRTGVERNWDVGLVDGVYIVGLCSAYWIRLDYVVLVLAGDYINQPANLRTGTRNSLITPVSVLSGCLTVLYSARF
ncbi:hypothetical protein EX30DRAFT_75249 [Ascodesmis nigricans]|uniref:Uncharacterized protein n=1 Tax=Ascodesmis nigricans TaxID=341454 RepID=A0A4S2MTG1_9PEZI|nr:hypothetical protein EX30DRAFT_75249 [Ascodesmis nigricans]